MPRAVVFAVDDAPPFGTTSGNISSRTTTAAKAAWSPASWTTIGDRGVDQQTPDLAALVQEVVDRPGWRNGNAIAIIVTGSGERTADSYNGNSSGAPSLEITYTTAASEVGYMPNPGFIGTDSFSYTIADGQGGTDTATVTITVGAGSLEVVFSSDIEVSSITRLAPLQLRRPQRFGLR